VHSVFRRAYNLIVHDSHRHASDVVPDGLVTVAAAEVGNLPNGVLVLLPPGYSFEAQIRPGEFGTMGEGALRTPGMAIELTGARPWDPSLSALRAEGWKPGWRDRWALVARSLAAVPTRQSLAVVVFRGADESPPSAFVDEAKGHIRQLFAGCVQLDSEIASASAASLIGLGPGLTPSGDDLVVGLLAGLWCQRMDDRREAFLGALARRIVADASGTTMVSRAYLKWAARGYVTQRLCDLARAIIVAQPPDQVMLLARRALDVGSTSGIDGVCGLLLGLSAWMGAGDPSDVRV
jgi:hypothetical protein